MHPAAGAEAGQRRHPQQHAKGRKPPSPRCVQPSDQGRRPQANPDAGKERVMHPAEPPGMPPAQFDA